MHRIVVVGGGAGGLELVTRLGTGLGRRGRASVTLGGTRPHPYLEAAVARSGGGQHRSRRIRGEFPRPGALGRFRRASNRPGVRFSHKLAGRRRLGQTFEFEGAEVPALEKAAALPASSSVYHHLTRPSEALQASSDVWRLTDRCLLARITRANRLADHHQPRLRCQRGSVTAGRPRLPR